MEKIKVIIKEPYKTAVVTEIENTLETKQKIVGGLIECIPFPKNVGVDLIINEEGKLNKLDGNFFLPEYNDCIVGTAIIASYNSRGEFASLTDKQIKKSLKYIKNYELKQGEDLYKDFYSLFLKAELKIKSINEEELN